jgi:hypothetical protein
MFPPEGNGQPRVPHVGFKRVGDELVLDREHKTRLLALPGDIAIRELQELDADDDEAVCSFLRAFGMVIPEDRFRRFSTDLGQFMTDRVWFDDVQYRLRLARCVARHALAFLAGDDVRAPWLDPWFTGPSRPRSVSVDDCWGYFVHYMNDALKSFAPRVQYMPTYFKNVPFGIPTPDLYDGLCAQVFNLVAEGLPVRRCANETCGRAFTRQRDRAQHGQYRTSGVMYCSRACARAQAKRIARRKQRAAKRNERKDR